MDVAQHLVRERIEVRALPLVVEVLDLATLAFGPERTPTTEAVDHEDAVVGERRAGDLEVAPQRVAGLILEDAFFASPGHRATDWIPWRDQLAPLAGQPREVWAEQAGQWPFVEGQTRREYFGDEGVWRQVGHWMQLDLATSTP